MARRSILWALVVGCGLATSLDACHAGAVAIVGRPHPPTAKPGGGPAVPDIHPIGIQEPPRVVEPTGSVLSLTGKVKIISEAGGSIISEHGGGLGQVSDDGLGIISNNTGGIIANNGGGIVTNNGGSIVANNGGGLTGKTKYGLLQTSGPRQFLLADAQIELLDARGRILTGADGQPIRTTTDAQGNYKLSAKLPDEALVLRIRLYNGGQLFALAAKGSNGHTIDLDTASSLGARYVLAHYVQGNPAVYDRLPPDQADALHASMRAAQQYLPAHAPSYQPDELVADAEALRARDQALDQRLETIKAILLAGQTDLGDGLPATQVPLADPVGLVGDGKGTLYIAEATAGRLRRLDPDGTIHLVDLTGTGKAQSALSAIILDLQMGPDGALYTAEAFNNRVRKIVLGQAPVLVAGDGSIDANTTDGPAAQRSLNHPDSIAFEPDGGLLVGESGNGVQRVVRVGPDGNMTGVPLPLELSITGLAVLPDGTRFLAATNNQIFMQRPGKDWHWLWGDEVKTQSIRLLPATDGVYVSDVNRNVVWKLGTDGTRTPIAGTGTAGDAGDGGPATAAQLARPEGIWRAPDGSLYIADSGNGLVRRVDPAGTISTVAGTRGATQTGDALDIAVNQPAGLAVDSKGRLIVAESGSGTIKRLDDGKLTTIAGGGQQSGDGGPATQAHLTHPTGLAADGDTFYFCDTTEHVVRRVAPDGTISTVAGSGNPGFMASQFVPALSLHMHGGVGIAVGPDHHPCWSSSEDDQIQRLNDDGQVELIVGATGEKVADVAGDGGESGPGFGFKLNFPGALVFDKAGNLYFIDTLNMRLRKRDTAGNVTTVAGLGLPGSLAKLSTDPKPEAEGSKAHDAALIFPLGLTIDDAGNLYVSELGTEHLDALPSFPGLPADAIAALPKVPAHIRRIAPDGTITTIAGPGTPLLADDSGNNSLVAPVGLLWNGGRLYIADAGLNQLKALPKGSF